MATPLSKIKLNPNARLRFAPSPTGHLHIGGLRTALYNHLLARKWGGKWILRIEDTDQGRKVDGAVDSLRRSLDWAGLEYDEGPGAGSRGKWSYVQSERLDLYRFHVQQLLDTNHAYRCFCTPDELAEIRDGLKKSGSTNVYDRRGFYLTEEEVARKLRAGEKYVVRFKSTPGTLPFTDLVYGGTEAFPSSEQDDMVILKSDGFPTYHLASVVDDHEMGITHVLRGQEWMTSVNKHLQLYKAFGWESPEFAHLPLLVNPDGSKLSKRHGAVSVEEFRAQGYEPSALLNFVGLMGWSGPPSTTSSSEPSPSSSSAPTSDSEPHKALDYASVEDCLTIDQMIEKFDVSQIVNRHTQVSIPKLLRLQKFHVTRLWEEGGAGRAKLLQEVKEVLTTRWPESARASDDVLLERLIDAERVRLTFLKDIALSPFLFEDANLNTDEAKAVKKKVLKTYLPTLHLAVRIFTNLPLETFESPEQIVEAINSLPAQEQKNRGKLWTPIRHALTGMKTGPTVAHTISFLGKEETLKRLRTAIELQEQEELASSP
ncbi:hypothetical protein BDY24DRAFT_378756 [Mrakia frigida]|uniref:glutamate--tRNA ligase MSE1 n=1 Tax=Mrakia frigida TaxID=29902 RepID=UPI003FCC118D